jgi:hypothetical protein
VGYVILYVVELSSATNVNPVVVTEYNLTAALAGLVPLKPLRVIQEMARPVVGVVLAGEQLTTCTLFDCKHIDSPVACAFAYSTSPLIMVTPVTLQVLPDVAVVVPTTVPAFFYRVMVAVAGFETSRAVQVPETAIPLPA